MHWKWLIQIPIFGRILFLILLVSVLVRFYFSYLNDLKCLDIHRKKGNYDEARDLYLKSLQKMESLYGQNHPAIADIMNNLGILLKKEGKYNEALDYLKRALRISKHFYGQDHPTIGIYLTNVGDIQRKVNKFNS